MLLEVYSGTQDDYPSVISNKPEEMDRLFSDKCSTYKPGTLLFSSDISIIF
jgi:hypothetical protein